MPRPRANSLAGLGARIEQALSALVNRAMGELAQHNNPYIATRDQIWVDLSRLGKYNMLSSPNYTLTGARIYMYVYTQFDRAYHFNKGI